MPKLLNPMESAPEAGTSEALNKKPITEIKGNSMTNNTLAVANNQSIFNFNSSEVRAFADTSGEFWFLANDICAILGYKNPRDAISKNCKRGGVAKRDTPTESGIQQMTYINEPNLYRLIIKSRMPEAEAFEEWVMEEVLPQIRKTGQYQPAPYSVNPMDALTKEQQDILRQLVTSHASVLPKEKQAGAIIKTWSKLKAHFKVPYREIPQGEFSEALSIVQRTAAEWELVDDLPSIENENEAFNRMKEHFEKCMDLAIAASTQVQHSVFRSLLNADEPAVRNNRFLFSYDRNGNPSVREIDPRASVTSPSQLAKMIPVANDYFATESELTNIAKACLDRLQKRF